MRRLDTETITKMWNLKKQGKTLAEIKKETGISNATIVKYTKNIKPTELKQEETPSEEPIIQQPRKPQTQVFVPESLESAPIEPVISPEDVIVEVRGIPINKKIQINPKNLTLYEWFRAQYRWDGDLSDFVNDTMEYFFSKGLNAEMQVIVKERI